MATSVFVAGHGDFEGECGSTRVVQLWCTGGSHLVYGTYLFIHHIYLHKLSSIFIASCFLDKYCTLHCHKLADMESLPTCD